MEVVPVIEAHAGDGLAVLGHAGLVVAVRGVEVLHTGIPPDHERQLCSTRHVCTCDTSQVQQTRRLYDVIKNIKSIMAT